MTSGCLGRRERTPRCSWPRRGFARRTKRSSLTSAAAPTAGWSTCGSSGAEIDRAAGLTGLGVRHASVGWHGTAGVLRVATCDIHARTQGAGCTS
jgi:hypothetical protein